MFLMLGMAAVGMFFTGIPVKQLPVYAADITVSTEQQLFDAISSAPIGSQTNPYSIELSADISLSADSILIVPADKHILLTGNFRLIGANMCPTIVNDGDLTIDGITITHKSGEYGRGIDNNGILSMKRGRILFNTTRDNGSGVYNSSGSTFAMSGGTISGNTANSGGGVYNTNSTFTMSGGTISGNTTTTHGGGVCNTASTFTISGGTIMNNTANTGGGVFTLSGTFTMSDNAALLSNMATNGGGVYNSESGTFTMLGGTISGNTANFGGGVSNRLTNSIFYMSDGTISGNTATIHGGGVRNITGIFTMSGGTIMNNTANTGGGVYNAASGTFTMSGGTISNNAAANSGGGVYNTNSTFTMSDNAALLSNIATGNGGGVYNGGTSIGISGNSVYNESTFTMSDNAALSGNMATNGGGVYNESTFTMSDNAALSGNIATGNGGGVYNGGDNATISIAGGMISGNVSLNDGGGIWTEYSGLNSIFISAGVIFSNNTAATMHDISENDKFLYNQQILSNTWTYPFIYGYNNYDIAYNTDVINRYTIVYMPGEHGGFSPQVIHNLLFGDPMPKSPQNLGEIGWKFVGWDPAPYTIVVGNATFVAQWKQADSVLVTFVDYDGTALKTEATQYGSRVIAPANYVIGSSVLRTGYVFTGWDGPLLYVTNDLTLTAQYIPVDTDSNRHLVVFQDWNGTFLRGEFVEDGKAALSPINYVPGDASLRTGYVFTGWDNSFSIVTSEIIVSAQYKPLGYNDSRVKNLVLGGIGVVLITLIVVSSLFVIKRKSVHNHVKT